MTDLSTRVESDRAVLSVLRRMRPDEMDEVISGEARRLREIARAAGLTVTGDAFGIFHAPITEESDGPLEIAVPVDALLGPDAGQTEAADVRSYRLAGGHVAERLRRGSRDRLPGDPGALRRGPQLDHRQRPDAGRPAAGDLAQRAPRPRTLAADDLLAVRDGLTLSSVLTGSG